MSVGKLSWSTLFILREGIRPGLKIFYAAFLFTEFSSFINRRVNTKQLNYRVYIIKKLFDSFSKKYFAVFQDKKILICNLQKSKFRHRELITVNAIKLN